MIALKQTTNFQNCLTSSIHSSEKADYIYRYISCRPLLHIFSPRSRKKETTHVTCIIDDYAIGFSWAQMSCNALLISYSRTLLQI
ncbi:uncharacterized protein PHALS_14373 [Plasmopara halstedii]|uniref:Uncharacterized protein n=1 Tax=Plasmopara halstedii TaxID=4781 RepID=A0A0P1AS57_PLAHL|nr:uncharacterized protein PHALS_14373 [Plasmopara halstedii]CEG44108.1 hypothetical protein PHALS_14373 [Plasmopara halstedii]|eukprot:XP_024580477.1 hypothetical protein PHALS_14373 [Plasmopara halstedii]